MHHDRTPTEVCNVMKDPQKPKRFRSALSGLHKERGHQADYRDACDECMERPASERHLGCELHNTKSAHLYRRGNPRFRQTFMNTLKGVQDPNYEETGSSQLLPWQLRLVPKSTSVHYALMLLTCGEAAASTNFYNVCNVTL
jgi:hypothetical protein